MPALGQRKAGRSLQVPGLGYITRFRPGKETLSAGVCVLFYVVSSGQQNYTVRLALKTKLNQKVCSDLSVHSLKLLVSFS